MNATVDLTRARLVELDNPGGGRLTATRPAAEHAFTTCAVNGNRVAEGSQWTEQQVLTFGRNITVLAEFPATLADFIPDGCTEFRFPYSYDLHVASRSHNGLWSVTGKNGTWPTLSSLGAYFGIDPTTVVPLVVDPQYVEERR